MNAALEFAILTAFDRIDIHKGTITGSVGSLSQGGYCIWTLTDDVFNNDEKIIDGSALDAITELVHLMDAALAQASEPPTGPPGALDPGPTGAPPMDRIITAFDNVYRDGWLCVTVEGWSPTHMQAFTEVTSLLVDMTDELESIQIIRRSAVRFDWTIQLYRKKLTDAEPR